MTVDRTIPHRAPSPCELLRTTLMRLSVHVIEQCAAVHITDDNLFVTS